MKIALIGNQNSGKTTLFNKITGENQKVGNWPGVTIEKKVGKIKETNNEIIDLPGIYSLSPYTLEEVISRDFIFKEKPDVIINIVDATSLERSLYLTTQLMELDIKIVLALNMADLLEKRGIKIDILKLKKLLKLEIVEISALKGSGIDKLINCVNHLKMCKSTLIYNEKIEEKINYVEKELKYAHKRFVAIKLLEQDEKFKELENYKIKNIINNNNYEEEIAIQRYKFIEKVKRICYQKKIKRNDLSNTLDKIFLSKLLGFPIFVVIMFLIYYVSVGVVGKYSITVLEYLIENINLNLSLFLANVNVSLPIVSLITEGIMKGVGTVIGFVPQLAILFLGISILETSGYMSRIALLMDRMFKKIGLSGKALIPFIVGSGCSVPGIMTTRILENNKERQITTILTPFIPCSAKLPMVILFTNYFFKNNSGVVATLLYFLSIIIIIISSFILKKVFLKNEESSFITELPRYKIPSLKYIFNDISEKIIGFIKKAGTIIFISSIIIWCLLSFNINLKFCDSIQDSILAGIGKKVSWVMYPIVGVNSWELTVSSFQGIIAKEQVISSMAIISEMSENEVFGNNSVFNFLTPISAYSFLVFNLFNAPCFAAIAAMKEELGSYKKMFLAISFQIIFAWILSSAIFQVGRVL